MFVYSYVEKRYYNSNDIATIQLNSDEQGVEIQANFKGFDLPVSFLFLAFPVGSTDEEKATVRQEGLSAIGQLISTLNNGKQEPIAEYY